MNKNILALLLMMVFSCSLFLGCDAVYHALDKEGAEEKEIVGEIFPYEVNPAVEEIQQLLKIYGYNPGEIDGSLGLRTRNAIERFQKDLGLNITRYADKETWKKLSIFKQNKLIKDKELNIVLIQQSLKKAGCNPGDIDGKNGPKTKAAIKKFQEKMGLKVDGKVGYKTLTKMLDFLPKADVN